MTATQPRHPKGTQKGGQWKANTPDTPQQFTSLSLDRSTSCNSYKEGDTAVIKIRGKQRTLKYRDGMWGTVTIDNNRIMRRLTGSWADTRAQGPVEIASHVAKEMLNDGDMLPDPDMLKMVGKGVLDRQAYGWGWPPLPLKMADEHKEYALVDLAANVRCCALINQYPDITDGDRAYSNECILTKLGYITFQDCLLRDSMDNPPYNPTWHGVDGELLHRLVQQKVGKDTLINQWLSDPTHNATGASVCSYLISVTPMGDPLHQKCVSYLNKIDAGFYIKYGNNHADISGGILGAYGYYDPPDDTNLGYLYYRMARTACYGHSDSPTPDRALDFFRSMLSGRKNATHKRIREVAVKAAAEWKDDGLPVSPIIEELAQGISPRLQ